MDETRTDLLIIGAGPFGLALAADLQERGIAHTIVGTPMGFWSANMPEGMYLRSTCDWSLDPLQVDSIDAYLKTTGRMCDDVEPLSRNFYLEYAAWFQERKAISSLDQTVVSLGTEGSAFVAVTDGGRRIRSRFVVLAVGFGSFAYVPPQLEAMFPRSRYDHTCHLVDFRRFRDRRVLVIGGRQSAFEWAAMLREAGAHSVDLCYRHDTPNFAPSDWSWVNPIVDGMADDPGWYRRLGPDERQRLNDRFWAEGRLKLEPWLASRIDHAKVRLHPRSQVSRVEPSGSAMRVKLNDGETFTVDHAVLATGYRVDMAKLSLLADSILPSLSAQDGFPVLDQHFQSNVPGLYVTSLAATRDFGSFLGFTVSARAQAQIIGRNIERKCHSE